MRKFLFISFVFLGISWIVPTENNNVVSDLPNIIFILLDDSEYTDIGIYGSEIRTPNIDSLGLNGVFFESFYNNAVCSPSRAASLTGMYPHRVGMSELSSKRSGHPAQLGHINLNYITLAEYLKMNGYATAMSGKWHLGQNNHLSRPFENPPNTAAFEPLDRGFDMWSGIIGAENNLYQNSTDTWIEDGSPVTDFTNFYGTDFIGDKAIEYVNNMQEPFFLYNPHVAPHKPPGVPLDPSIYDYYFNKYSALDTLSDLCFMYNERLFENDLIGCKTSQRFAQNDIVSSSNNSASRPDNIERYAVHSAMVESVDIQVGKLINALKAKGQLENTIFIIASDNGPDGNGINYMYDCPFTGWKPLAHTEGDIKTYGIWHWGDKLKNGVTKQKGSLLDIFPTIDDIVTDCTGGIEIDSFDGVSLKNTLLYGQEFPRELCIYYRDRVSIYNEDCIKYEYNFAGNNNNEALYNYKCDGYTALDFSETNPTAADTLLTQFRDKYAEFSQGSLTIDELNTWNACYPLSYNELTQQCE